MPGHIHTIGRTFPGRKGDGAWHPESGSSGMSHATIAFFPLFQRSFRKGVSVESAAPWYKRHRPLVSFDAARRADEAKAIVIGQAPFMMVRWRRGSGPMAADHSATAARPSMNGTSCVGGFAIGLPPFPCTLGQPGHESRFEPQLVGVLGVIGVPEQALTSFMACAIQEMVARLVGLTFSFAFAFPLAFRAPRDGSSGYDRGVR